jgi:hypothetical protein
MKIKATFLVLLLGLLMSNMMIGQDTKKNNLINIDKMEELESVKYSEWISEYVEVELTSDISHLTQNEKQLLMIVLEVAKIMDDIFWYEAYGNKDELLKKITHEDARKLALINYGPWNRLHGNEPNFKGIADKPKGANFYPTDMTIEEFENFKAEDKKSLYTLIRRDSNGNLISIPYHVAFKEEVTKASQLLKVAAVLAEDEGLKKYLNLRAEALLTDDYLASDLAWMDMKTNRIDFVVGPIENYEDHLFSYKAAHESFVLIKDMDWSQKLDRYAALLPKLQTKLPVPEKYKKEIPGSNSDLGAYDAVYYAGDCNAGSKTIAINLPNDPKVHIEKGSRKLQLKNSMRAKFDNILSPIADELIDPSQRKHVTFDAFFGNTMFHEVAHGLGIKYTINGKGEVRPALKEQYSAIEEGKADILGLFLVTQLQEMGEIDVDLMDNYVTFMAGIFRSIRFGASSSHAKSNLVRFNFFKEMGAFSVTDEGKYVIDFEKMQKAMNALSEKILILQGNGDYDGTKSFIKDYAIFPEDLNIALDRLKKSNIPVDVVFKQGAQVLKLN